MRMLYILGNYFYRKRLLPLVIVINVLIRVLFRCVIYSETKIGKNVLFAYGGIAIVIHKKAVIGDHVTISQCVTIGGRSGDPKLPVIGNDVYLGAGAKVLGGITIGDGATIGAGAVVLQDVAPGEVWAGVPARKLK